MGDITNMPFNNSSYDSIVCTQVIGDVFNVQRAFNEMYRVLKPQGHLMLSESLLDPLHDEPNDYWRFTPHSLRRLAENSGFNVNKIEKIGGYSKAVSELRSKYWKEKSNKNKFVSALIRALDRGKDQQDIYALRYLLLCSK